MKTNKKTFLNAFKSFLRSYSENYRVSAIDKRKWVCVYLWECLVKLSRSFVHYAVEYGCECNSVGFQRLWYFRGGHLHHQQTDLKEGRMIRQGVANAGMQDSSIEKIKSARYQMRQGSARSCNAISSWMRIGLG